AGGLEAVEDPAVRVGQLFARRQLADLRAVHERKLGGVVQLRREVTGGLRGVLTNRQVRTWIGATGQGEAQRVSAVVAYPVHRIDAVAQGLGHLAAVLVANETVEEDVLERHLRAPVAGSRVLAIGLAV